MIEDILEYNKRFVENKGYEKYITNKYPDKKIAILSCMDTRLTELLPAALYAALWWLSTSWGWKRSWSLHIPIAVRAT